MNSIIKASTKSAFHTFNNMEFTGVFDTMINNDFTSQSKYHLFIKYGDKVYMEVKDVGEIVISFVELQNNKYWKYYYELSIMLTNNKNLVIQDLKYSSEYNDCQLYEEERFWSIDTASIENNIHINKLMVINYDDNCYYKINPYELENMEYTSIEGLNNFQMIYMTRDEFKYNIIENILATYYNLVVNYKASLMEKNVEELADILQQL
jgi:hypothetical protein